jgi:hypothetical protein
VGGGLGTSAGFSPFAFASAAFSSRAFFSALVSVRNLCRSLKRAVADADQSCRRKKTGTRFFDGELDDQKNRGKKINKKKGRNKILRRISTD